VRKNVSLVIGHWERLEQVDATFNATSTTFFLLAIPTTTLPCFTASLAYSTWNIRPCGELRDLCISFQSVRIHELCRATYKVTESLS
jgi:hypothetical protein